MSSLAAARACGNYALQTSKTHFRKEAGLFMT
ncbi:hypothetical protein HNE_1280 [Hyphomonas neptunium ATCC 15444]|uniref:Uncharacterized protein n=1 Tax=Hyphomonas neptunium (strain ATCC 15444) TaxID=228405 RepID=Q0C2P5_HYPNA|nr:hypothetical protein HNE_1280 [Hyphomonas neptunium ATCC 15444]